MKTQISKVKGQNQIEELQKQIKVFEDNWKRALADYQNLVKRMEGDKAEIMKLASLNVVNKLIPTLDVLEMAAAHTSDPGVTMAVGQFRQVLADEGLQQVMPAVGDKFDPSLHECTETISGEPVDGIAEVVLKGYKINGYILRPAKVKVYKNV